MEIYVALAICDLCGAQGPHHCRQIMDELEVRQATHKGRPVQIAALPGDELEPICGVLMRHDPPDCCLTVWR